MIVLLLVLLLQFSFYIQTALWHRAQYLLQILLIAFVLLHYIVDNVVDNLLSESNYIT